jgi:hypothetical protein
MSERDVLAVLLETDDERIAELEAEGLTHSDAVGVAMTEARARLGLLIPR